MNAYVKKCSFLKPLLSFQLTIIDKKKENLSGHCKPFKNHRLDVCKNVSRDFVCPLSH